MIELVIATRNKHKIKEIKKLLEGMPIEVISLLDGNWDIPEVVEDGSSFKENATKKAQAVCKATGKYTLADDSGLEVDALGGQPGIYSARFSGENASDRDNNVKLLTMIKDIPADRRGAQFRCAAAIASPDGKIDVVEGICRGEIGLTEEGGQGFGYDPIFIPVGYNMTFAELSMDVKNKISHRGRALEKAKLFLERLISAEELKSENK